MANADAVKIPWQKDEYFEKWASKPSQTVNSPQYKELKKYIHKPYKKVDNNGTKCFYFPTYVIFKIKNITEFDFESLSARINGVLIIHVRIDYEDMHASGDKNDKKAVDSALEQLFKFKFGKMDKSMDKTQIQSPNRGFDATGSKIKDSHKTQSEKKDKTEDIGLKNYLYIQFNRDDPLRLPSKRVFEGQIKQENKQSKDGEGYLISWTIRKEFTIALSPGTFGEDLIAPFNLLNFKLTLIFEDIDIKLDKNQGHQHNENFKFKFNCMKRVGSDSTQQKQRIFEQLLFTDDGSLGEYDLAETGLKVDCYRHLSKQFSEDVSSQYSSFKVVTFTIPFYKYPIMDALTIFIPLALITILTLFTFVQGPNYNDKIGNIATLMIVYVGLMPVINDSLPPTTKITLIDLVLYFQLTISVLCLVRGKQIKDFTPAEFDAYRVWGDGYFIVSVVIAVITAIILVSLLVYYCIMKSLYYNLEESDISDNDRKMGHWVSPHMHQEARNVKTIHDNIGEGKDEDKKEEVKGMVRSPSIESFTNKIEIGERGKIEEQELKKEKRGNRD